MPKRVTNPDLATLQQLLLWCRKERISLQQVTVGAISLVGHDMKMERDVVNQFRQSGDEAKRTLYEQYAGDLLPQMANGEPQESADVIEDD